MRTQKAAAECKFTSASGWPREPVTERNDLFGATVQLAARLCSRADPGGILVAGAMHDLALGKGFAFRSRGRLRLKGFDSPMSAFEVVWQTSGS